jgi:hypothetical protein
MRRIEIEELEAKMMENKTGKVINLMSLPCFFVSDWLLIHFQYNDINREKYQ